VIDPVVDHLLAGLRDPEKAPDIAGGAVADGDDFVLPAGEGFDDDPAVKHAGEVILPLHVEGGQVVDGADAGAGGLADEAAVAGDVQDVELEGFCQAGQFLLVPHDVLDGGGGRHGHGNQAAAVFGKIEKWQLLFQDKDG